MRLRSELQTCLLKSIRCKLSFSIAHRRHAPAARCQQRSRRRPHYTRTARRRCRGHRRRMCGSPSRSMARVLGRRAASTGSCARGALNSHVHTADVLRVHSTFPLVATPSHTAVAPRNPIRERRRTQRSTFTRRSPLASRSSKSRVLASAGAPATPERGTT